MGGEARNLFVVEIKLALSSFADFWSWRVEARNIVDYRRRTDRWWRDLALNVWLNQDAMMRGIVALGPVTPDEFLAAFTRWSTALRPITPSTLRDEVYAIVQLSRLTFPALPPRRYQNLKLTIAARRNAPITATPLREKAVSGYFEPMPILL
ncbi:hypothetical protein [Microvirga yunnanensis]|uniref:hypothetical protein n=1 Tax=Microvirga yunnanensis TaxID=2953740 RepID=UPI0021C85929|nr:MULTISPECIES: hypothetical protein [unclassified Microvirga]